MLAAQGIQFFHQREGGKRVTVHRYRSSVLEADGHATRRVRRFFRTLADLPYFVGDTVGWIFQRTAFVADVPNVAITAVNLLDRLGNWHVVLFGVFDRIFPRLNFP